MISLKARLNYGLVAILFFVFATQWALGSYAIRRVVEHEMLTRLEHDGDSLLASLRFGERGEIRFDPFRLGLIYEQAFSGHYFIIQSGAQRYPSLSLRDGSITATALPPGQIRRYHCDGPQGQPLLVLARGLEKDGQAVSITVAEELTAIEREIKDLSLGYLALTGGVLLLAIILQSLDVRRALRPLSAVRDELLGIARGEQTQINAAAPTEIQPVVDKINWLLELMDRRLQQSRTATGNLAHALKTPLAVLFRVADDPKLAATPELARLLQEQTAAIHRRIERELRRARLSGSGGAGSLFNPQAELSVLAQLLGNVYQDKRLDIEIIAADRLLPYDREDLLELIGNLADNACKWAVRKVLIQVGYDDEGISVEVADDGPGCPFEAMERLTQRGLRLDETKPGHGLGLAIARDIAEFYRGYLELKRSQDLGGLAVSVFLPNATPTERPYISKR